MATVQQPEAIVQPGRQCTAGSSGFDIARTDTEVRLRVTAPAAVQPLLDTLSATFDGDDASDGLLDMRQPRQHPVAPAPKGPSVLSCDR